MKAVIRHLRAAALCGKGDGPSDGQLLEYFVVRRDETAFAALVRRHGSMVLGVCQRLLRNVHDAEDAFQATFLVLARKAASVKPREVVGNWLYGVAYRTALKARAMNAKRRTKEKQAGDVPRAESSADEELLARLDHELNRLPDKYRVPVVLCELEGRTRKEVARTLGIPEGTLSWRLAQAKKLLGRRLSRYGGVALTALLAESAATACASPLLRTSTVKTVLAAGAVPAKVLALTEGVMKAMFLSKLKITVCMASLVFVAGVGTTGLSYRATAQQPREGLALANRSQADELEALRLEIEALRKSLHATRERVKSLEVEVRTMKRAESNAAKRMQGDTMGTMQDTMRGMMQGSMPGMGRGGRPSTRQPGENTPPSPAAQPGEDTPASGATVPPAASGRPGGRRGPRANFPTAPLPSTDYAPAANRGAANPGAPQGISPASPAPAALENYRRAISGSPPPKAQFPSKPLAPENSSLSLAEKALKRLRENPNDTRSLEMLERALQQLKEPKKPSKPAQPGGNSNAP
jgi:RNA polymerase sigma factor (sigma-70 family)